MVLDFYRYVAAIGVFLFHTKLANPETPIHAVGSYGLFVDMFFILSGFVICFTYRNNIRGRHDYWNFIVKRIARVYPLYIIMLIGFYIVQASTGNLPDVSSPASQFIINAAMLQSWGLTHILTFNTPGWSISAELACYLAFPIIAIVVARLPILIALGLVGASYIVGAHGHLPFWFDGHSQMYGANFDFGFMRALIGFLNGVVLCRLSTMITPRRAFLPIGVGAMVAAIIIMNVFAKPDLVILLMAAATLFTALGETAFPGRAGLAFVFEWFGNTSYAIYMIHVAFLEIVVTPLLQAWQFTGLALFAALVGCIVSLTIMSHFIFLMVEAPARRWVTRMFARKVLSRSESDTYQAGRAV